jgi:hypothetical protein
VNTISGLPAHVLLVHAIVVLAPLTALLEILCILPAVRRRLMWLVLVLAVVTAGLSPVTTGAGQWPWRWWWSRSSWRRCTSPRAARKSAGPVIVAIIALAVGISTIITVYRIGDAGSRAVWGGELTQASDP